MTALAQDTLRIRRISVVIPLRNEAEHVADLVADLAAQDFDGEVEVLVADGDSDDGSRHLLEAAAAQHGVDLTVVPNPRRIVAPGLNECIRRARGDLVVRLDAHARYPRDYLRRCVEASEQTGADNVGGVFEPEGRTPFECAVACALSSPFGGVNWTRDAGRGERVETDTVWCGAFRPAALRRAGLFDEELVRNQDDELNLRIRATGGRIVLDPAITARYRPRGSLRAVFRQYRDYGFWKVRVVHKHRRPGSARSWAPIGLVGSLGLLAALAPLSRAARRALLAETAAYGAAAAAFGAQTLRRRGEPLSQLPSVVATFGAFHLGYGIGVASGVRSLLRQARGRRAPSARRGGR
jgi:glycosyltransferase involved in cell wall biosynthesis